MQTEFLFTHPVEIIGEMTGVVTVPTNFDPVRESLPVIVFLHGSGERGTDPERVKVHGIPMLFTKDPNYHGLRAITLSPQCPDTMVWPHLTFPLMQWIKAAVAELNGDRSRISITGLSMGGFGTWEMITTFPDYFSCAAPVCGGGLSWRTAGLREKPIRVYHGLDDAAVPFTYARIMVDSARAFGATNIDFIAYDKVGHGSWFKAYGDTDLIEWLIAQKLE